MEFLALFGQFCAINFSKKKKKKGQREIKFISKSKNFNFADTKVSFIFPKNSTKGN